MKALFHKKNGFTIIELLIVIAIIGLLSSVVLASLNSARQKAKIAKAKVDLNQILKAMLMYEHDTGELPRRGDNCSEIYCCGASPPYDIDNPGCVAEWNSTMSALTANDGQGWNGPYLSSKILEDPWGHHYLYDDNYVNANCGDSWMRSAGPDETANTADDILVNILPNPIVGCY